MRGLGMKVTYGHSRDIIELLIVWDTELHI